MCVPVYLIWMLAISSPVWLVPNPLPNQGCSLITSQVCCQGPLREANAPCSGFPLKTNMSKTDCDPSHVGASLCRGTNMTATTARTIVAAMPLARRRYCRSAIHIARQETVVAQIAALAKLLINASSATNNANPSLRREFTVWAVSIPQSRMGTTTTPMTAPNEFDVP